MESIEKSGLAAATVALALAAGVASAPANAAGVRTTPPLAAGIATAPPPAAAQAQDNSGDARYVWKDPDGRPLPFQSDEQVLEFLRTAEIESIEGIELGVTNPRQVVLQKDGVRMRAALRDYEETFTARRFDGVFYARLRDSYLFDVAAYETARLLGLNNVPPVVLRRVGGDQVSVQAWLEGGLMESDRIAGDAAPPSALRFRQQTQDMRAFDTLIGNVDRNTGNILYDEDGDFWLIDHSRAFQRDDDTRYLDRVTGISRSLFVRLQQLERDELMERLSPPLTPSEVDWMLRRRDKLVAHINRLIEERGEEAVLFGTRG